MPVPRHHVGRVSRGSARRLRQLSRIRAQHLDLMAALHNVIVSGGGTGAHSPALAIADEIKRRNPNAQVRFVGALGRMEMEKVPAAGYDIDGLWISGIDRSLTSTRNISFPFKLISSLWKARRLLRKHRPQAVVGVGGFAKRPFVGPSGSERHPHPHPRTKQLSGHHQPPAGSTCPAHLRGLAWA